MARLHDELLAKYLSGHADPSERARVEAWAAADLERSRELDSLKAAWDDGRPEAGVWDVDTAWAQVSSRLDQPVRALPFARRRWLSYAAAAVVVLAAGWLVTRTGGSESVYLTGSGIQQTIELADGSRVVLAPASRLQVDRNYGTAERVVTLEGRAWFEVVHDGAKPFRVQTAGAIIEDLGTAFEVLAPVGGGPVQVAVVEGSVAVRASGAPADQSVTLGPRDLALVGASGLPVVRHEAPVQKLVSWREGRLDFDEAPVSSIVAELGRWYGVTFRLADTTLGRRTLNSTFPTANLSEVIEVLRLALGVEITRTADTFTLAEERRP